jgi:DnaJ family protein C protein 9
LQQPKLEASSFLALTSFAQLLTSISDKAHPDLKDEATTKFQEIAFAYAVLSDPIRRKRYDVTGSTAESLSIDQDFSFADFYSEQFRDIVTSDAIEAFSKTYKGSDEEKDDVLAAYENGKGEWDAIYETVMLSNPLEDEERFRVYIDEAIKKGEVKGFKAYTKESKKAKKERMNAAKGEAAEAEEMAKELGVHDKLFKKGKGSKENGEDALKALIQGRSAGLSSIFDNLEAKYGGQQKKGKKGKRSSEEVEEGEPSEEAFQAARARLESRMTDSEASGGRKAKKTKR